jgi:alpha-1,3-rhamnosyl/mannosyltransferase
MLLRLMQQRRRDRFTFVLCRGSEKSAWWQDFRRRIDASASVDEVVLPWSRRVYNALTLAGAKYSPRVSLQADAYICLDAGTMGPESAPLIQLVTDLSVLKGPAYSSMRWHGRWLFKRRLREGARLAERTVCISHATASDVMRWLPGLAGSVRVIPNGIADEWFAPMPAPKHKQRARPYFIWYGYISPRKNLSRLLNGYAEALKRTGSALPELLLVGNAGRDETRLTREIEALGLEHTVLRLPAQPLASLIQLVSESRGLAFPSLYEGFGVPIIETFARGIPVLTSNVTAMPEVAGGLAGLCDPLDYSSIAQGLISMAQFDQLSLERMHKRKAYAAGFTAERAASSYSRLIDEVLTGVALEAVACVREAETITGDSAYSPA